MQLKGAQPRQIRKEELWTEEKIRSLQSAANNQSMELENKKKDFRTVTASYRDVMTNHKRVAAPKTKYQKKRDKLSQTKIDLEEKLKILNMSQTKIDLGEKLKKPNIREYFYQDIILKMKKLGYLVEKIKKNEERIEGVQRKVDGLSKHITKAGNEMEHHTNVIEKECQETTDMQEKLLYQNDPKFLLESMDKIDSLSKQIEKYLEEVKLLKVTRQEWLKKSQLLVENIKEWEDDVKIWNETSCKIEKCINIITLRFKVEEEIKEYHKMLDSCGFEVSHLSSKFESWVTGAKNLMKSQDATVRRFQNNLEEIKSLYWKNIHCPDSYITSCCDNIAKGSQGLKELENSIKENRKEISKIGQLGIVKMQKNFMRWKTKVERMHREILCLEGDRKLSIDEGMIAEYEVKLMDLSGLINMSSNQLKCLQKKIDDWHSTELRLEKKLKKTDKDLVYQKKLTYEIEHHIRMNRLLEADVKMKALCEGIIDLKNKQTRQRNKGMKQDINITRIKSSKEEFFKMKYNFWDYDNIWNCGQNINSELSKIDSLSLNIDQERQSLQRHWDQHNKESRAVIKELEKSKNILDQKYEKIQQKPEHWSTSLLDDVKHFWKQVDGCDENFREKLSEWEKKQNDFKGQMISYENHVRKQEEMISSVELGIHLLKCQLEVKNEMDEYKKQMKQMESTEWNEDSDWGITYGK